MYGCHMLLKRHTSTSYVLPLLWGSRPPHLHPRQPIGQRCSHNGQRKQKRYALAGDRQQELEKQLERLACIALELPPRILLGPRLAPGQTIKASLPNSFMNRLASAMSHLLPSLLPFSLLLYATALAFLQIVRIGATPGSKCKDNSGRGSPASQHGCQLCQQLGTPSACLYLHWSLQHGLLTAATALTNSHDGHYHVSVTI